VISYKKAYAPEDVFEAVLESQKNPDGCILCGTKTHNRGVLTMKPDTPLAKKFGPFFVAGRVYIYAACDSCLDNKKFEDIEDSILKKIKVEAN
jgi:hypothetical protein